MPARRVVQQDSKEMKIGLFALETGRQVGGLEVYETNLIRALAKVDQENEYRVFCLDPRVPEILGLDAGNFRFDVRPVNRFKGVMWDAPRAMSQAGLDLFHALFVPPPFTPVPYVFTYHGSEVMERPDFYPFALGLRMRLLFRRALRQAGLILCVSEYVRHYLATERGLEPGRLRTVHHGCRPEFRPIDKAIARDFVARKYALENPYLLSVGRIEPRKNPVRVLRAYHRFLRTVATPPNMVFVGMKNWGGREFDRAVGQLGLRDSVRELGHVSDEDLPMLYAASEFVVFASLWEGFGLPLLEAFSIGTPVIASRTTSLPEVAGGASLLVDPCSEEEIAKAMTDLYRDRPLREELVRKGLLRAQGFSWEQTARETVKVYAELHAAVRPPSTAN